MSKPKVSVITITYNHEKYIEQTLKSIVSQESNFDFEVIVADDRSTDKTADIIRELAANNPSIKPILRNKNIGAHENFKDAITQAKGEYIALCEGDDYWTDNSKLQQQVDFLDKHKDYGLCFHPVRVFFEKGEKKDTVFPDRSNNFTVEKLLRENFIQTNSVMYRAAKDYSGLAVDVMPYDWYLHLFHTQFGKIGFIDQVMSAYRRHEDGMWWNVHNDIEQIWIKNGLMQFAMFERLLVIFGDNKRYASIIKGSMWYLLMKFIELDTKRGSRVFTDIMVRYPGLVAEYVKEQITNLLKIDRENNRFKQDIAEKTAIIAAMKESKFWKLKVAYDRSVSGVKSKRPGNK